MKSCPSLAQDQLGCLFRDFWTMRRAGYSPRCSQHFCGVNPEKSVLPLTSDTSDTTISHHGSSQLGVCSSVVPDQQRVLVVSQDVEINLRLLNLGTVGWTIKAMQETPVLETWESFPCRPGFTQSNNYMWDFPLTIIFLLSFNNYLFFPFQMSLENDDKRARTRSKSIRGEQLVIPQRGDVQTRAPCTLLVPNRLWFFRSRLNSLSYAHFPPSNRTKICL